MAEDLIVVVSNKAQPSPSAPPVYGARPILPVCGALADVDAPREVAPTKRPPAAPAAATAAKKGSNPRPKKLFGGMKKSKPPPEVDAGATGGLWGNIFPRPAPPPPEPRGRGKLKSLVQRARTLSPRKAVFRNHGRGNKGARDDPTVIYQPYDREEGTSSPWCHMAECLTSDFLCSPCAPCVVPADDRTIKTKEVAEANETIKRYGAQIDQLKQNVAAAEAMQKATVAGQIEAMKSEVTNVQTDAQRALEERNEQLQLMAEAMNTAEDEVGQKDWQVEQLMAKIAELEKGHAESQSALKERDDMLMALRSDLTNIKKRKDEAEKERDAIKQDLTARIHEMEDKCAKENSLQTKINELSQDIVVSLTNAETIVQGKDAEMDRLKSQIAKLEKDLDEKNASNQSAVQERDATLSAMRKELDELNQQKDRVEKERDAMEKDLTAKIKAMEERTGNEFALQEKIQRLSQEITVSMSNAEKLVNKKNGEVESLKSKIAALEEDMARGHAKNETDVKKRDESLADMRADLYKLTKQKEEAMKERDGMEKELTKKITVIQASADKAIAKKTRELAKMNKIASELEDQIEDEKRLKSEAMKEKSNAISSMENWLGAKASFLNQISKDVNAVRADANAAIQKKEDEGKAMAAQMAELQSKINEEARLRREALTSAYEKNEEVLKLKEKASTDRKSSAITIDVQTDELKKMHATIDGLKADIEKERRLKQKALKKKSGLENAFQKKIDLLSKELAGAERKYADKLAIVQSISQDEVSRVGGPGPEGVEVALTPAKEGKGIGWLGGIGPDWLLPHNWMLGGDRGTPDKPGKEDAIPSDDAMGDNDTLASVDMLVDRLVGKISKSAKVVSAGANAEIRAKAQELKAMEARVQELQSKIDREIELREKALAEKALVEHKMRAELGAVQNQRTMAKEVKYGLEAKLRKESEQRLSLQEEIDRLRAQQDALGDEARRVNEGALEELQKIAGSLESETKENSKLKSRIAELKRSVKSAVAKQKAVDEEAGRSLAQSLSRNDALNDELRQVKRNASSNRMASKLTIDALHDELAKMQDAMESLRESIEQERQQKVKALKDKSGMEVELQRNIDSLSKDLADAEFEEKMKVVRSLSTDNVPPCHSICLVRNASSASSAAANKKGSGWTRKSKPSVPAVDDASLDSGASEKNSIKFRRTLSKKWMSSSIRRPSTSLIDLDTIEENGQTVQPKACVEENTYAAVDRHIGKLLRRISADDDGTKKLAIVGVGNELRRIDSTLTDLKLQANREILVREEALLEKLSIESSMKVEMEKLRSNIRASRSKLQLVEAESHQAKRRAMGEARAKGDLKGKLSKWEEAAKDHQAVKRAIEERIQTQNELLKCMEADLKGGCELRSVLQTQIAELKSKKEELQEEAQRLNRVAVQHLKMLAASLESKTGSPATIDQIVQLKAIASSASAKLAVLQHETQHLIEQAAEATMIKGLENLRSNIEKETTILDNHERKQNAARSTQTSPAKNTRTDVCKGPTHVDEVLKHVIRKSDEGCQIYAEEQTIQLEQSISVDESVEVSLESKTKLHPKRNSPFSKKGSMHIRRKGAKVLGRMRSKKWKPSLNTHDEMKGREIMILEERQNVSDKRHNAPNERDVDIVDEDAQDVYGAMGVSISLPSFDSSIRTVDSTRAVWLRNVATAQSIDSTFENLPANGSAGLARSMGGSIIETNSSLNESWSRGPDSIGNGEEQAGDGSILAGWLGY